jgi:hypothetical protein
MLRSRRPKGRLLTAATVLTAGLAVALAAPAITTLPAQAAPITDCTEADPIQNGSVWEVHTPGQLLKIAKTNTYDSSDIVQLADLDLAACSAIYPNSSLTGWATINGFSGSYNGNGHTIYNVSISSSAGTSSSVGLFSQTDGATITNLVLDGVTISANSQIGSLIGQATDTTVSAVTVRNAVVQARSDADGGGTIGGLIGQADVGAGAVAAIENVLVEAIVAGKSSLGGLIGNAGPEGTLRIADVVVDAQVSGTQGSVGGLIGYAEGGSATAQLHISSVSTTGSVTGTSNVGGLIGELDLDAGGDVSVSNSFSNSTVIGSSRELGGLIGDAYLYHSSNPTLTITSSYATGNVSSSATSDEMGGLIGRLQAGDGTNPGAATISASYATGNVTSTTNTSWGDKLGGLIGEALARRGSITINDSFATGDVWAADDNVGGFIGEAKADGTTATLVLTHVTASGTVRGDDQVGGLIGYLYANSGGSVTVSAAQATGNVSATDDYVGGLIGQATSSGGSLVIEQSMAEGDVIGNDEVGGLIGYADIGGAFTVRKSFATGAVGKVGSGAGQFGGLIGLVRIASGRFPVLTDVYALGGLSAPNDADVGGLIGEILLSDLGDPNGLFLTNSFAIGEVNSGNVGTHVGGLIGKASATFTATASFWDTATSKQSNSAGGTGTTTANMKAFATFNSAGWSIANGDADLTKVWGICDGTNYPFLMWQTELAADLPGAASCGGNGGGSTNNIIPPPPSNTGGTTTTAPTTTAPSTTTTTTVPPTTVAPTDSTPPPVLINGALPTLPIGDVVVLEDGQPVTVNVFVDNNTELVLEANTFQLRLEGDCSGTACTIDTTPEGREVLTLEENGQANTRGVGFEPGSQVDVWLFSEPRYLGALTVNADGTFEGNVDLGDINPGEHTLQVNGTSQTGSQRSANLGVIVNSQQTPTPEPGVLPATGTGTTPIWVVALALLSIGLVLTSRRRTA